MVMPANVSVTSNSATISWSTNKASTGRVYYSTVPIVGSESMTLPYLTLSGTAASDSGNTYNHSVTISGLAPNTSYYYVATSTDQWGNVSMSAPRGYIFTTQ